MQTIYEAIRHDHDRHRQMLERIAAAAGDLDAREAAWDEFYYDVKSHAAAEEETFYARLMETEDGQDDARHSVSEHKELDDLMEELRELDLSDPSWMQRFAELKHDYEHHMDEEEDEIFSKAKEVLTDDPDGRYAGRFLERKRREEQLVDKKASESLED